jgi:glycosyltransferase involved in cell wall biosynthesis
MNNLSNKLTVFVLVTEERENYRVCLEALNKQTVSFKLDIVKNIYPMSKAMQEPINRCKTPYFIQCDEDIILNPTAIETMYNAIELSNNNIFMICYPLTDCHLNRELLGVKIFKHNIVKNYSYDFNNSAYDVEFQDRIKKDGYKFLVGIGNLGQHSPYWTNKSIFERYLILGEKFKQYHWSFIEELPKELLNKYNKNPTELNWYALLGILTPIIKDNLLRGEKDARKTFEEFDRLVKYYDKSLSPQKLKVLKVIDWYGWAYHFIYQEQIRYTKHNLSCQRLVETHALTNIPWYNVIYLHGVDINIPEENELISRLRLENPHTKIIGAYGGEKELIYKDCDIVVSISLKHMEFLKEKYPNKPVIFLPESVDTNYFKPTTNYSTKCTFGWAGRESVEKRVHLLNKLQYPIIKKSDHNKTDLIKERTLEPMKKFYKDIDVLILVSKTECMPRVVLEAMACGLPVISTNVGSLKLLIEDKWLVSDVDEDNIIKEINKRMEILKRSPKLRKKIGKRNRKFVEKYFSWKVNQPLWDSVFELINNGNYKECVNIANQFLLNLNNSLVTYLGREAISSSVFPIDTPAKDIQSITPITKNKIENIIPDKEPFFDEEIFNILNNSNLYYWIAKETLLYIIQKKEITSKILYLGTNNEINKNIILDLLKNIDFKIEIEIDRSQRIKDYNYSENIIIKIPKPVVLYLRKYTKNPWEQIING